jgi:RNA polymerase sigma factor (sigma-70 family)
MSALSLAAPRPLFGPSPRLAGRAEGPPVHRADPRADRPDAGPAARATDESRLLVAARDGDPSAFEALVRRHQRALFNFCVRMLGQPDDAADVAQEAFVQLYQHLGRLDAGEPLAPWLYRVARNRCIDHIRRRRTVGWPDPAEGADAEPADEQPLPDELAERADLQRLLTAAIAGLPPVYAEVVALRYAADRSFAEIAAILDCDEGAARVRFHRAKALLRQRLRAATAAGTEARR